MNTNNVLLTILSIATLGSEVVKTHAADSPPKINFSMLGEVRTLDVIDGTLGFSDSLKKLNGRRVSLIGFMAPFDDLRSMRRCMIVPSYVGCRFCNPPDVEQVVYITQGSGESAKRPYPFIEEPSHVSGTFRISLPDSDHEGKKHGFVYSIENAVVTAHNGDVPKRAPVHRSTPHQPMAQPLPPVSLEDLIEEVTKLVGQTPRNSIAIKRVPAETFGRLVRSGLETNIPRPAARALFAQLLPEDVDWIDALVGFELVHRVATTDNAVERVPCWIQFPPTIPTFG